MHSEIYFWILKIILFIWLLCTVWFFFPLPNLNILSQKLVNPLLNPPLHFLIEIWFWSSQTWWHFFTRAKHFDGECIFALWFLWSYWSQPILRPFRGVCFLLSSLLLWRKTTEKRALKVISRCIMLKIIPFVHYALHHVMQHIYHSIYEDSKLKALVHLILIRLGHVWHMVR